MQIKRGLSVLFYMIFFIFLGIYNEFLEYIQLNEVYRLILILLLFFINSIFTIYMNNIEDKVYKKLRIPYVLLWSLIIVSFSLIILSSIEVILCFWAFLFIVYTIIKLFIYKKVYENPLEKMVLNGGKFRFIIMIIVLCGIMGFFIYKITSVLTVYNKTTTGFFVNYEKENIYNIYEKYYPTFSFEIDENKFIRATDTPVFFKIYKTEDEKEIKLLYNENNPNHIIIRSQVFLNIVGDICSFLLIITITALHIKYNIRNKNKNIESEK